MDYHRKLETLEKRIYSSVRRRGKTSTRRRCRIPCVVVEKITTRRREGIGVVVEKNEEIRRTFNKNSCDLLIAITHTEIMCALYKTNKQFNKKTKLWKPNGRCLDDVTTAYSPYRKLKKINMNFQEKIKTT